MIYFIKDQTRLTWGYSEAVFLFRATSLLIQPDRHEPEIVVVIILSVITANTEICFFSWRSFRISVTFTVKFLPCGATFNCVKVSSMSVHNVRENKGLHSFLIRFFFLLFNMELVLNTVNCLPILTLKEMQP